MLKNCAVVLDGIGEIRVSVTVGGKERELTHKPGGAYWIDEDGARLPHGVDCALDELAWEIQMELDQS